MSEIPFKKTAIGRWIAIKRYRVAMFIHDYRVPIRWGDKSLGHGDVRKANLRLMMDRWDAKAPKPEDYGLSSDTARSRSAEQKKKD